MNEGTTFYRQVKTEQYKSHILHIYAFRFPDVVGDQRNGPVPTRWQAGSI